MKNTTKILALVLVVMTVLMSLTAITASAAVPAQGTLNVSEHVAVPAADKDAITAGTTYVDGFFTIVGTVTTRWSSSKGVYAIELDKKSGGAVQFTVSNAATVTVSFASTGGTNNSVIGLVDANGTVITPANGVEEVTGTTFIQVTYDVPAGTYKVVNPGTDRNTRVESIAVVLSCVHTGGTATCMEQAVCTNCGESYGELSTDHNYVDGACSVCGTPAHVNTLTVGETNTIVIDDTYNNGYGYYVTSVVFAAEEDANYSFVGEGLTIWIYDINNTLLSTNGSANLEAGYYTIFIASNLSGTTGTYNVAVTKSAWVYNLAVGDNSVIIDAAHGALDNGYGYPTLATFFTVTEKANYSFAGEGLTIFVYDATSTLVSYTSAPVELDAGVYTVCAAYTEMGTTGTANITITKTAISEGGETPELPTHGEQKLVVGDNTVVIDGCTLNISQNAVEWLPFEVTESATYNITCSDLTIYILSSMDMLDSNAYVSITGMAQLEAGTTYYILAGKEGVTGTFTVNVTKVDSSAECAHDWANATCKAPKTCKLCGATEGEANPDVHAPFADTCLLCGKDLPSFKAGDNHVIYVPGAANLMANGDLYAKVEITEPGVYVISGGAAEMIKVYMWTVPTSSLENGQLTMDTPYGVNIDPMTESGLADYFVIELPEAGVYWIGFSFNLREEGDEGCEFNINISLHAEHEYVNGKCEVCGEAEPVADPDEPIVEPVELSLWDKILAFLMSLLAKIRSFLKI